MASTARPGERYTIRRQIFKILGAGFHVYDAGGRVVGYCTQRAFKLREDLRIFTDDSRSAELMRIQARSIIDFGATYDVALPGGERIGSVRRKGLKSLLRDEWVVLDAFGSEAAILREDSGVLALLRRAVDFGALLAPQRFSLVRADGTPLATYRQHFNPLIYRLGVTIHTEDETVDDLMVLAVGCLIAAIEGRED